ncbi:putative GH43/DUF377 family glycosyl hydrolase [Mucilaginibacter sp. UYP25]
MVQSETLCFQQGLTDDDIGQPNRIDVYYGMADDQISVAKMEIPDTLPGV